MAVVRNPISSRLTLELYEGDDMEGNPINRRTSYAVKSTAAEQDLYDVSLSLASLTQSTVISTYLAENTMLEEE